ncbi:hypothetical protein [Bradyrhizobium lupini]|uniref:hypothetical protein n=1 Tax=Rhizobium lupini TaxID=136996 RepID=UPI0034C6ACB2
MREIEDLAIDVVVQAVREAVRPTPSIFSLVRDLRHPRHQVVHGDWEKRRPAKRRKKRDR